MKSRHPHFLIKTKVAIAIWLLNTDIKYVVLLICMFWFINHRSYYICFLHNIINQGTACEMYTILTGISKQHVVCFDSYWITAFCYSFCDLYQRCPTTFDLWAVLQKWDNLRTTFNKMMCYTTDSKLKRENRWGKWGCVIDIESPSVRCQWLRLLWNYRSFNNAHILMVASVTGICSTLNYLSKHKRKMVIWGIKLTRKQPAAIEITLLIIGCTIIYRDKWIMIIRLWWLSQWLVTYGHHLLVTINYMAPSPGCHTNWRLWSSVLSTIRLLFQIWHVSW